MSVLLAAEHAWHWDIFAAVVLLVVKGEQDFTRDEHVCLKRAITGVSRGANGQREEPQGLKSRANIQELNMVWK